MPSASAVDSTMALEAAIFRLMDLPVELRVIVYEIVVTDPEEIRLTRVATAGSETIPEDEWNESAAIARRTPPPITRVDRTIRVEALPLYYKHNTFTACYCRVKHQDRRLKKWLDVMGPVNRAAMRKLFVSDPMDIGALKKSCILPVKAMLEGMGANVVKIGPKTKGPYRVTFPKKDDKA